MLHMDEPEMDCAGVLSLMELDNDIVVPVIVVMVDLVVAAVAP